MSSPPPPAPGAVPKLEPPTDPGTAANSMRDKIIAMQAEGGIDGKITQYPTAYKPPEPANAEATSVIVQFVKFKKKDQPPFTVVINVADPSLIQAVITPPPDGKGEPKAVSVQPLPAAPTPEKPNADPETPKNQPGTPESPNGKDKPNSEPKGEDEDDDDEQSPTNSSTGASPAMTTYYDIKQNPIYTGVLPPPTSKAEKSSNNTALIGATAAFAALFALSLLALFLLWRRRKKTTRHDPETYSSPTSSLTEKAPAIVGAAPRGGNVEDGPVPDFYLVPQDDNTLSNAFNGSYQCGC
ncbi:hypothetical protein BJ508DRAFT_366592 [Ascobolus immersus RN42]|uniref:Uncharacterized protein n=1 Tax=Ascobolus immersus RN42 TaxID=1160509 RepID=A0A3N4HIN3_ASCIM|nr:hypothetical protein BJ508DRAFT_366592 [Ascobolus immersus RN42]